MNDHPIHAQPDGPVDWPYKLLLQVMSPTPLLRSSVQRLPKFSAQCTILARTSQLHLCLRKWMRDKALECWIHHCSRRTEKQVQPLQEFITPLEKVLCQAHLTFEARGDVSRYAHTNGNRAETQEAQRRHIPQVKGKGLNIKKFEITYSYEQVKQPKENRQPYQDSLKLNFIRDCSLKSKDIRYHLKHDLRCIYRS